MATLEDVMHKLGIVEAKIDDLRSHAGDQEMRIRELERSRSRAKGVVGTVLSLGSFGGVIAGLRHLNLL